MNQVARLVVGAAVAFTVLIQSGCASGPDPNDLPVPEEITCINFPEPIEYTDKYGLGKVTWTSRLERGPYWSERFNSKGTFFRGPPGGVSIVGKEGKNFIGQGKSLDGGIFVPNDPGEPITVYRYFSPVSSPVAVPAVGTDCDSIVYMRDPVARTINVYSFAKAGAVGGAIGGVAGRAMAGGGGYTYGQSAGIGIVGGAVAGLIVGAIIKSEIGRIYKGLPIRKDAVMQRLQQLAKSKVVVKRAEHNGEGAAVVPSHDD